MSDPSQISSFRTMRYALLNKCRWDHFLSLGILLEGKTIFEPGAGIGDQTEWLLKQNPKHVYVNEGRPPNMAIIQDRFRDDSRITFVPGELEEISAFPSIYVDLIFCWGVYYHLRETFPDFHILRGLAGIGPLIVMDYLAGSDAEVSYGYDNPSTSITQYAFRPKPITLMQALKDIWGNSYWPNPQLKWTDPDHDENRLVAVASREPITENPALEEFGKIL